MERKILTTEQKLKIIELYQSGQGSDTVAKQFDIHPNTVLKILKAADIERRPIVRKKIQIEDEPKIIAMYQEGLSAPEIAKQFDVSDALILRYLERNNIERRDASECHRIYPIHEDFFDVIDTQEKAYFLGFLYADGGNNIDYNFTKIDLSREDRDILVKLAKLIFIENAEGRIVDYERTRETRISIGSYLDICSKHICHQLFKLGCVNKKSLILTFPQWLTDPELQRHFIRGYYDGDGGIYLPDKKALSTTVGIISTLEFCEDVKKIILQQIDINVGSFYNDVEGKNVYSICFSGNRQIAHFLNWLYKDSIIHLDRKYELYLKLLAKNEKTDELILAGTQGYSKRYYQK